MRHRWSWSCPSLCHRSNRRAAGEMGTPRLGESSESSESVSGTAAGRRSPAPSRPGCVAGTGPGQTGRHGRVAGPAAACGEKRSGRVRDGDDDDLGFRAPQQRRYMVRSGEGRGGQERDRQEGLERKGKEGQGRAGKRGKRGKGGQRREGQRGE